MQVFNLSDAFKYVYFIISRVLCSQNDMILISVIVIQLAYTESPCCG